MRNLLLAVLVLTSTSLFAQKKADDVAKFNVETFDFGKIKQNVPVTATFIVTNISDEPLIIDQANPSCGCTVSDYTKSPIAPGKTGFIKATYNAADLGPVNKQVTVKFANSTDVKFLNFKGEVSANAPAKTTPKKTSGK
jgi:hypothetical protein